MVLSGARRLLYACLAAFVAGPCIAVEPLTVLRVQGSNTIGTRLLPALVEGAFESRGLGDLPRPCRGWPPA